MGRFRVPVFELAQAVEEGDLLAILESMKMEIPVESPGPGIVNQILIAPEGRKRAT